MSRSVDETRREFLKRLARSAAFVPPALLTLSASRAGAQSKGQSAGKAAAQAAAPAQQTSAPAATAIGGTTPSAQTQGRFQLDPSLQGKSEDQPWDPGRAAGTPPWAKPPPTSAGGSD